MLFDNDIIEEVKIIEIVKLFIIQIMLLHPKRFLYIMSVYFICVSQINSTGGFLRETIN